VVIRIMRASTPTYMKWVPITRLIESANVGEYGS
jgi:hypothetical protein